MHRPTGSLSRNAPASLAAVLAAALLAGCGRSNSGSTEAEAARATNTPAGQLSGPGTPPVAVPGQDEKACFACAAQGTVPCRVAGCRDGKVECPGPCLKLTRGAWVHMTVAGHDPSELWQKFPNAKGKGYQAWNQHHLGEVIVMQNGGAVNIGPCRICGGTTRVPCAACKGQGRQTCEICQGKKFVPLAWTATDNPWLNRQPDLIRLKDGRVLLGKIVLSSDDDRAIKTRNGKITHVNVSEILPPAEAAGAK